MISNENLRNENISNSEKRMNELGEKNYFECFSDVYKVIKRNTNKY